MYRRFRRHYMVTKMFAGFRSFARTIFSRLELVSRNSRKFCAREKKCDLPLIVQVTSRYYMSVPPVYQSGPVYTVHIKLFLLIRPRFYCSGPLFCCSGTIFTNQVQYLTNQVHLTGLVIFLIWIYILIYFFTYLRSIFYQSGPLFTGQV